MSKSAFLQSRVAAKDDKPEDVEVKTDEKAPETGAENGELLGEVMDFAALHRNEIYRSEEPVPTKLREMKAVQGSIDPNDYMVPKLLSGSDLSGDTVHVANYKAFLKRHEEEEGVFKLTGGYQAFGIGILLSAMTDDILDELKGLEDYNSLDDEILSGVEREAIEDAWLDWARYDFINALQAHIPESADAVDEMSDEQVMELFTTLRKKINAEWVFETGGKAFINVDQIASEAEPGDLPKPMIDTPQDVLEEAAKDTVEDLGKTAAALPPSPQYDNPQDDPKNQLPEKASSMKSRLLQPKSAGILSDEALCDQIAAMLTKNGFQAEGVNTGGHVYCVQVQLQDGGSLLWGMAAETWAASGQDANEDYTGNDVFSDVPSDSTDVRLIANAIAELSVEHGARMAGKTAAVGPPAPVAATSSADKSYQFKVVWRVVDRVGPGAFVYSATFEDFFRTMDISAEEKINEWVNANYSEDQRHDDDIDIDYRIYKDKKRVGEGRFNWFNYNEQMGTLPPENDEPWDTLTPGKGEEADDNF